MYRYRNRNTGDEYESAEPNGRLERLPNWDRIAQPDEPSPVQPGPLFNPADHTAADVLAYLETGADRDEALRVLDLEAGDGGKQRSTVLAAREGVEARES